MKRIIKIIVITLISILCLISIFKHLKNSNLIYNKIIKNNKDMKTDEVREINLYEYTPFEWDTVIIYNTLMSNKEISEYLGYNHDKYYDLQSGWIFVKDNNIVYEEEFPPDNFPRDDVREFYIYINDINNRNGKIAIKNDGYFLLEKKKYGEKDIYRLFE